MRRNFGQRLISIILAFTLTFSMSSGVSAEGGYLPLPDETEGWAESGQDPVDVFQPEAPASGEVLPDHYEDTADPSDIAPAFGGDDEYAYHPEDIKRLDYPIRSNEST